MAITIHLSENQLLGNTIHIDKVFTSGKDRISINGQVVFEDKLVEDSPYKFEIEDQTYFIRIRKVHKLAATTVIDVEVYRDGKLVQVGMYDKDGNLVKNESQAQTMKGHKACSMFGGVIGGITIFSLSRTIEILPGGALGGAISGVIGGMIGTGIGYGFGLLIFGRK